MNGLRGGADDAFITPGAAGLILLNPRRQKLFPPPPEERIRRSPARLKDKPFLDKISNEEKKLVRKLPTQSQVAMWVKQARNSLAP